MSKRNLTLLISFILLLSLGGLYMVFRPQVHTFVGNLISQEQKTSNGEETVSCSGEEYTSQKQGYKVCYPQGWHTREFGYSQLTAGFDPFPIPEASEYPGMFTVRVVRDSSSSILSEHLNSLEDPSTEAAEVDGVTGIEVAGTFPSDSIFFADYFQVVEVVENLGRTYTIQLLSSPDSYEENLARFEEFVGSFQFLDDVSSPPWGKNIFIENPWPGDTVSSSFRIVGSAEGIFENTIVARLKNANDEVMVETPITFDSPEPGGLGQFNVEMSFTTSTPTGVLEVYHTSPKDGSIVDLVSVPLNFE